MAAPNAYISLHDVDILSAYAEASLGNPLMLSIDGVHGKMRIALFFNNTSDNYAKRLADAISAVPLSAEAGAP